MYNSEKAHHIRANDVALSQSGLDAMMTSMSSEAQNKKA